MLFCVYNVMWPWEKMWHWKFDIQNRARVKQLLRFAPSFSKIIILQTETMQGLKICSILLHIWLFYSSNPCDPKFAFNNLFFQLFLQRRHNADKWIENIHKENTNYLGSISYSCKTDTQTLNYFYTLLN